MTRKQFLAGYRAALIAGYAWAADADKLARFMQGVEDTLAGTSNRWHHKGPAVTATWRGLGGKGVPTLKALRALPAE